jgi:hypothetical protein
MVVKSLALGAIALALSGTVGSANAQAYLDAFPYVARYGPAVVGYAQRGGFNRAYDGYNRYVAPSVRQGFNYAAGDFRYQSTPMMIRRR